METLPKPLDIINTSEAATSKEHDTQTPQTPESKETFTKTTFDELDAHEYKGKTMKHITTSLISKTYTLLEKIALFIFILYGIIDYAGISIFHFPRDFYFATVNVLHKLITLCIPFVVIFLFNRVYLPLNLKLKSLMYLIVTPIMLKAMFIFTSTYFGATSQEYIKAGYTTNIKVSEWLAIVFIVVILTIYILPIVYFALNFRHQTFRNYAYQFFIHVSLIVTSIVVIGTLAKVVVTYVDKHITKQYVVPVDINVLDFKTKNVYLSENYKHVFSCLYTATHNPLYKLVEYITNETTLFQSLHFSYYNDDKCLVLLLPKEGSAELHDIDKISLISEAFIRGTLGQHILQQINNPVHKIVSYQSQSPNFFDASNVAGYYIPSKNQIIIKDAIGFKLEVIMHEQLHAFTSNNHSNGTYPYRGLNEGTTQYLTMKLLASSDLFEVTNIRYVQEVNAVKKLVDVIGEEALINTYFNGDFLDLEKLVDEKLYTGAYCTFNEYLNNGVYIGVTNANEYKLKEEMYNKAVSIFDTTDKKFVSATCKLN